MNHSNLTLKVQRRCIVFKKCRKRRVVLLLHRNITLEKTRELIDHLRTSIPLAITVWYEAVKGLYNINYLIIIRYLTKNTHLHKYCLITT